jgi:hypothetical protein
LYLAKISALSPGAKNIAPGDLHSPKDSKVKIVMARFANLLERGTLASDAGIERILLNAFCVVVPESEGSNYSVGWLPLIGENNLISPDLIFEDGR